MSKHKQRVKNRFCFPVSHGAASLSHAREPLTPAPTEDYNRWTWPPTHTNTFIPIYRHSIHILWYDKHIHWRLFSRINRMSHMFREPHCPAWNQSRVHLPIKINHCHSFHNKLIPLKFRFDVAPTSFHNHYRTRYIDTPIAVLRHR